MELHWGKHHQAYVTNLNGQIKGTELENKPLLEIIQAAWNGGAPTPAFNNAGQVWNHDFFWESMSPTPSELMWKEGGLDLGLAKKTHRSPALFFFLFTAQPSGALLAAIDRDLGGLDAFKNDFSAAGATQFGSGWAWLVLEGGKLKITKTPNAESPLCVPGQTPLLTMDVWEHAYYVDYENRRPEFIGVFVNELINWDKVAERYAAAGGQ
jgi:superoxide dismutase, Fe-Mn family